MEANALKNKIKLRELDPHSQNVTATWLYKGRAANGVTMNDDIVFQ